MDASTARQIFLSVQQGDKKKLESLIGKGSYDVKNDATSILHLSIEAEQGEIFQHILQKSGNPNIVDVNGATPLHTVSKLGKIRYGRHLIEKGANIDSKDLSGATPLHWACQYGQLDMCKILCERGADIEARAKYDTTPLHIATRSNFIPIVQFLLDLKANTEVRTSKALTPLHIAAMKGLSHAAQKLLQYKAQPNSLTMRRCTPLHFAAIQGDIPTVKQLCRYSADVNAIDADGNSAQSNAIKNGHTYISAFLGRSGYPVFDLLDDELLIVILGYASNTTLRWFSLTCKRFYNAAQIIWKSRCSSLGCASPANPRLDYSTHFSLLVQISGYYRIDLNNPAQLEAALLGEIQRVGMKNAQPVHIKPENAAMSLLDHGANPNAKQRTGLPALHLALAKRAYDVVHAIVERGGDINVQQPNGNTALHDPAVYSCPKPEKVLNWLVGIGANPSVVNAFGDTAANHVAKAGQWKWVFVLAKLGCDVNLPNKSGESLLHIAASSSCGINIIHQLADFGVNIDQPGFGGNTALHITAEKGLYEMMQAILDRGANINLRNTGGATALHIAVFNDNFTCVQLLISYGADLNIKNNDGLTPYYFARLLCQTRTLDFMHERFAVHISKEANFYLLSQDGER